MAELFLVGRIRSDAIWPFFSPGEKTGPDRVRSMKENSLNGPCSVTDVADDLCECGDPVHFPLSQHCTAVFVRSTFAADSIEMEIICCDLNRIITAGS